MPLTFTKKAASKKVDEDEVDETPKAANQSAETPSTNQSAPAQAKKPPLTLAWMKKGDAAKEALAFEEAKAEMAKDDSRRLWRFRMQEGNERQITFLDGELDADGMLDVLMFYEHTIRLNGTYENFICTASADQSQPCPLCEAGDKPALVGVFTIVDHSEYKVKKGPNAGKIIKNTKRLFVAKRQTLKILTKLAQKRGGLTGCTFDVSRTGEKEPAVGNQFDFVHKFGKRSEIVAKYDLKEEDVFPAKYDEELRYRSPEELIKLGAGKAVVQSNFPDKASGSLKDEL